MDLDPEGGRASDEGDEVPICPCPPAWAAESEEDEELMTSRS